MVVKQIVDLIRIVRGVCKVELTRGSAVESAWYLMSAVGTQKKPPIDFETTYRWRSLAVTTFPAIPGSHSRLAGSPGSVSLPVSHAHGRPGSLGCIPFLEKMTAYTRAGVS